MLNVDADSALDTTKIKLMLEDNTSIESPKRVYRRCNHEQLLSINEYDFLLFSSNAGFQTVALCYHLKMVSSLS